MLKMNPIFPRGTPTFPGQRGGRAGAVGKTGTPQGAGPSPQEPRLLPRWPWVPGEVADTGGPGTFGAAVDDGHAREDAVLLSAEPATHGQAGRVTPQCLWNAG